MILIGRRSTAGGYHRLCTAPLCVALAVAAPLDAALLWYTTFGYFDEADKERVGPPSCPGSAIGPPCPIQVGFVLAPGQTVA